MEQNNTMQENKKDTRTQKIVITVFVALIVLALGIVGGYFFGQYNKNQEVERAKQEAAQAHSDDHKDTQEKHQKAAPAKQVTEPTCNADELSLAVEPGEDTGAGTLSYNLVLTNTGNRTCTLGGFPGVSLVNDNGNQIGHAASWDESYPENKLTLDPGTKAKAIADIPNSANMPSGSDQCQSGATKFRVYAPNDAGYVSATTTLDSWCPGFKVSPVMAF